MSDSVVVRIPASTSNCGPGFDTLGLALGLYGQIRLTKRSDGKIVYTGDNVNFPKAAVEMVVAVASQFSTLTGLILEGFDFEITSDVPIARGLGSSVILRGGVLGGLNHLYSSPLSEDEQVALISKIEGHPDNASAAILGGFTVARFCPETKQYFGTQKFPVSEELVFVVISPNLEIKTDDSRSALPSQIEFCKVISSLNSLSYLVAAFASKNYGALSACRIDHIHEPYRLGKIPHASEAIAQGIEAGAYNGWLSGSGSSVLCVTDRQKAEAVRLAMESAWSGDVTAFTSYVLTADNEGATILE